MTKNKPSEQSLARALGHDPADKRIDILRLVGQLGSISQAAREAKVSYKAAWQAIDTLTNLAGVELVERAVGGSGGGGARITVAGQKLLSIADLLSRTRDQVLASLDTSDRPLPLLASIGIRTSMRNLLPCHIEQLVVQGQMVRIGLRLGGTSEACKLFSRITKVSAQLLGLQIGQSVLALCKATAVVVTAFPADQLDTAQQFLSGRAVRVSRGQSGDEVSLQLDAGLQLVGYAVAGSGVKARARVNAWVDESAVVIALAG